MLLTALLVLGTTSVATAGPFPAPCRRIEVRLATEHDTVPRGHEPQFKLSVRNSSETTVRLLDTRKGRRRDLADNYYVLVVLNRKEQQPDIPVVISDPGPMSETDFFTLRPGEVAELPVSTPLELARLKRGSYRAFVIVSGEAYSGPSCASTSVQFRVR